MSIHAGRQPGISGANANGQVDVAPADGEEDEGEPETTKEASEGEMADAVEEEQGHNQVADDKDPEDRYEAKGAEHDEDHRYVTCHGGQVTSPVSAQLQYRNRDAELYVTDGKQCTMCLWIMCREEEDGGGDEGDHYDDEKVAETVEDLLK